MSDPGTDDENFDDALTLSTGGTSEGTSLVKKILGNKDFPYPKPLTLIKNLIAQASRKGDFILDFFAGTGTTGHAVLELNAEDGGQRRYILCASTEATKNEPHKNLCRDACAERMRRVNAGVAGRPGFSPEQGGEFAYLQLDRVAPADIPFEATVQHAHPLLSLRLSHSIQAFTNDAVQVIARAADCDILLCTRVDTGSLETLAGWSQSHGGARIAVYSERPDSLSEALTALGVDAVCYGLYDALRHGQAGGPA